ncbi:MAG: (E)-4-hydroxy-3-methylbut-2-enyl-diphosphate synthase [Ignavibacteria bacterium]|nr:(E)-4-hydroxy-3-methylbut-2-enyl-diphosphate synthase [Ignavibacteria bacterium]
MYKKKVSRFKTRVVNIGDVPLGGDYPIRLQSMTTTDTMDTVATVEQAIRIIEAGADYVRITAPSIKEAENLKVIKEELKKRGFNTPLIADIHFTPNAAEVAAKYVEKVRINPGNYADKKKFEVKEYTDAQYNEELERIRTKFIPLVKICKEYGRAMRIGVNHGSLSDRIMNRFGDTPLGMVESALEFVRICEDLNYYDIVISMKASNPIVMIDAYRLLVKKMIDYGMNYPIHLGVTEAGDGLDGRIKSSIGIGTLLEEGIGDTIRVSLTEEPENEIKVCKILVNRYYYDKLEYEKFSKYQDKNFEEVIHKSESKFKIPIVILSLTDQYFDAVDNLKNIGYWYSETLDKWNISETAPDYIFLASRDISYTLPVQLKKICNFEFWKFLKNKNNSFPLLSIKEYKTNFDLLMGVEKFVNITPDEYSENYNELFIRDNNCNIILSFNQNWVVDKKKEFIFKLRSSNIIRDIIVRIGFGNIEEDEFAIYSATDIGDLFISNLCSGIWLDYRDIAIANKVSFGILQAVRKRFTKTDFISCPSCGRTLFNLQETTARIKKETEHLKGLKIAIMGCIVNGPGEMADADYGYVGSGHNKVTLYKGKEIVKKNIDSKDALDELIKLIKENGDWIDK